MTADLAEIRTGYFLPDTLTYAFGTNISPVTNILFAYS
jgi:hypothetical protein